MIPLWHALALAGPVAEESVDHRGYLDQARFFVKKGWFADAESELVRATRHPDGRVDPEVWFLLAQVRYELADLVGARDAVDQALTWSRDEAQADATRDWLLFLYEKFGFVELVPPRPGLSSEVELELRGMILDPELKAWFVRATERLEGPVDLPLVIGLPAGFTYSINGEDVTVGAGAVTEVPIAVRGVAAQRIELQVSLGVGDWTGPAVSNLLPSPTVEGGVVMPLGGVVLGARGGSALVAWEDALGDTRSQATWTAGAELGVDGFARRPIGVRTGLSARGTSLHGLREGCPGGCSGTAIAPGVWAAALWRDPRRSSGTGLGLRTVIERASGRTDGGSWSSLGIRVVVDGSLRL